MRCEKLPMVVLVAVLIAAWGNAAPAQTDYAIISTTELQQWLEKPDKPTLVFSLSPIEYSSGHIPGSDCIPLELMANYYKMPTELDRPMVFYCKGPG